MIHYKLALGMAVCASVSNAFLLPTSPVQRFNGLKMSALEDKPVKAIDKPAPKNKVETIKINSDYLKEPLATEMKNDEIFITNESIQILKFHGSYQQDNRELRAPGKQKAFQFMLRLKIPGGETTCALYRTLDDLATAYGQDDLRATTRQTFQLHGVMKHELKTVVQTIMNAGASTVGGCGDVNRNVMTTPAPFKNRPEYAYAYEYSKVVAELFKPLSSAFTELWFGGEKAATIEYWRKDIPHHDIEALMLKNTGTGIIMDDKTEPIYGTKYLPRKFKIGVTVPGDNSIDIYTNDIGIVVLTNADGSLKGFNVMVGGGMGRTHNKESTFARTADHLCSVTPEDFPELMKSIIATQRDHGNREIRANARMKYLVHTLGVDKFRELVEGYFGKKTDAWVGLPPWKFTDWLGWYEQGDGKYFLGINIEQGRVKDYAPGTGQPRLKTALRELVDKYESRGISFILTPHQSLIIRDIQADDRAKIEGLLRSHGVKMVEEIDPLTRLSIACPALPLCGLAQNEAERVMPQYTDRVRALLNEEGLEGEEILIRMTGCPNGCARPYMAELAFVGDGPKSYQLWLGGSPVLDRIAFDYKPKVNGETFEEELRPILDMFKRQRAGPAEAFGDFCARVGKEAILAYVEQYKAGVEAGGAATTRDDSGIGAGLSDREAAKARLAKLLSSS